MHLHVDDNEVWDDLVTCIKINVKKYYVEVIRCVNKVFKNNKNQVLKKLILKSYIK